MSVRDADAHKLSLHPERVVEWLQIGNCFPLHAEIGITNRCNHKCKFCTLDWINHGAVDLESKLLYSTFEDFKTMGVKSIYLAGEGEPTLHKDFIDVVKYIKDLKLSVAMATNGAKLTKEVSEKVLPHFSWIRFSLDAINPETYKELHGVKEVELKTVLNNIEEAVLIRDEEKLDVNIGVQAIFTPENAPEIIKLAQEVRYLGVDNFQVKPAHNHPSSTYTPGIYDFSQVGLQDELAKLETSDFIVVVRTKSMERLKERKTYHECHGFNFYALIDANGDVVPCNVFYRNPDYIYGNLHDKSFKDIWESDRRKEVMKKLVRKGKRICGEYRCRLDVINRYLDRLKNPELNDEFI